MTTEGVLVGLALGDAVGGGFDGGSVLSKVGLADGNSLMVGDTEGLLVSISIGLDVGATVLFSALLSVGEELKVGDVVRLDGGRVAVGFVGLNEGAALGDASSPASTVKTISSTSSQLKA